MLLGRLGERLGDRLILRVIRRYLEGGVLADGMLTTGAQAGPGRADRASNNLANILRDLAVTLPRDQLRPAYGDGFAGAPWHPRTAGGRVSERDVRGAR